MRALLMFWYLGHLQTFYQSGCRGYTWPHPARFMHEKFMSLSPYPSHYTRRTRMKNFWTVTQHVLLPFSENKFSHVPASILSPLTTCFSFGQR
ncbi:unnamed protein product [Somion occarium]|uniref:Secreted protein n=1 Tax=Somion occarium TaxID=3059160 RepID=A0ABP1CN49_9APHY